MNTMLFFAALFSATLAISSAGLWIRSYFVHESWTTSAWHGYTIRSSSGRVAFEMDRRFTGRIKVIERGFKTPDESAVDAWGFAPLVWAKISGLLSEGSHFGSGSIGPDGTYHEDPEPPPPSPALESIREVPLLDERIWKHVDPDDTAQTSDVTSHLGVGTATISAVDAFMFVERDDVEPLDPSKASDPRYVVERSDLHQFDFDGRAVRRVWLPLSETTFAFLILPVAWAIVFAIRRRPPPGHCRRCGYDLRASPGRCPECGTLAQAAENPGRAGG